jgi:hypothetical protein
MGKIYWQDGKEQEFYKRETKIEVKSELSYEFFWFDNETVWKM